MLDHFCTWADVPLGSLPRSSAQSIKLGHDSGAAHPSHTNAVALWYPMLLELLLCLEETSGRRKKWEGAVVLHIGGRWCNCPTPLHRGSTSVRKYAVGGRWISVPIRRIDRLVHSASVFNWIRCSPLDFNLDMQVIHLSNLLSDAIQSQHASCLS